MHEAGGDLLPHGDITNYCLLLHMAPLHCRTNRCRWCTSGCASGMGLERICSPMRSTTCNVRTGLFGTGLAYGGPGSLVWGWVIVSIFTCFIALSMSEICSAFPTAGGIYYWSAMLSGRYGPFAAWVTAHMSFSGQVDLLTLCSSIQGAMCVRHVTAAAPELQMPPDSWP